MKEKKFMVFCVVTCNIIIQCKPTKSTFSKLIFQFLVFDVFYVFRNREFIFRRRLYIQVWNSVFYTHQVYIACTDACKTHHGNLKNLRYIIILIFFQRIS